MAYTRKHEKESMRLECNSTYSVIQQEVRASFESGPSFWPVSGFLLTENK